ncbi:MAG: sulfurtransferase TusA family protein [Magnetococcus sp. WYHC-3]
MQIHKELDARGMNCPMPIVKTRKELKDMSPGQVLCVLASDPGSAQDMAAFCRQTGSEMLATEEQGGIYRFLLRKGT